MTREEEGFAPVDGCRLYYEVRGAGPAIVLNSCRLQWARFQQVAQAGRSGMIGV